MHVDMCFRPDFSATFLKIVEPNHMFFLLMMQRTISKDFNAPVLFSGPVLSHKVYREYRKVKGRKKEFYFYLKFVKYLRKVFLLVIVSLTVLQPLSISRNPPKICTQSLFVCVIIHNS